MTKLAKMLRWSIGGGTWSLRGCVWGILGLLVCAPFDFRYGMLLGCIAGFIVGIALGYVGNENR